MATFLFKTEPSEYSFADLVREKRCVWSGVSSPAGLLGLRACRKGDEVLMYHTGAEKRIVGLAEVVKPAYPDPDAGDDKLVVVDLKPLKSVPTPVTLAQVKADARFADFALVRQSRLSVMAVPAPLDAALRRMCGL